MQTYKTNAKIARILEIFSCILICVCAQKTSLLYLGQNCIQTHSPILVYVAIDSLKLREFSREQEHRTL